MSLITDIAYGLENIGNEGLYPLIELMSELNWDPIDADHHIKLVQNVELLFIYLYNNDNNVGPNQGKENSHSSIHKRLYDAMAFVIDSAIDVDLFGDLLERSDDKLKTFSFNERFKLILLQKPEGLLKVLSLYTEIYHILYEYRKTLTLADNDDVKKAISQCKSDAADEEYYHLNSKQYFQHLCDKKYREILDKDTLKNENQKIILAKRILDKIKKSYLEKVLENINDLVAKENVLIGELSNYQALLIHITRIVNNHESNSIVSDSLNEIAKIPIVKENEKLRAFLAEQLFFKDGIYDDYSEQLKYYDESKSLLSFKPDLVKNVRDKLSLDFLSEIKIEFSRRIYKHDGLVETYVPVSMSGIKTSDRSMREIIYRYDNDGELTVPDGPLNNIIDLPNGKNTLNLILNMILKDDEENQYEVPVKIEDYFIVDENTRKITGFTDKFGEHFVDSDYNLDQLLLYVKLFNVMGGNLDVSNAFENISMKSRIENLAMNYYNSGQGDALYRVLSSACNKSVDFDLILERSTDKNNMLGFKKEFWTNLPSHKSKVKIFLQLLLGDNAYSYYDLMKDVYQYQDIKTRSTMEYQSLRHQFSMFKEKNLFRNGVETRQHVPAADEYFNLQVGDTQGSNISLTQIGDIATAYASRGNPAYSWIIINEPQKAINCTHYMESHIERLPAQEFSTGMLKSKAFLGAIKIKKVNHGEQGCSSDPNKIVYSIVDGFVSNSVLRQFSGDSQQSLRKIAKLYGLEGHSAFYLSRAIICTKAQMEGGEAKILLDKMQEKLYFNYDVSKSPIEQDRVRTSYQEKFDDPKDRRESISGSSKRREKSIKQNVLRIPKEQPVFLDPKSLRTYHTRQKKEILKTLNENRYLGQPRIKRLREEKQQRKHEKKMAEELNRYTQFSGLDMSKDSQNYASSIYSKLSLEQVPLSLELFSKKATFENYFDYIGNAIRIDGFLSGGDLKNASDKVAYAIEKLFSINKQQAELSLIQLINSYCSEKRLPVIQGALITTVIRKLKEILPNFPEDRHFSKAVQFAINNSVTFDTSLENYYSKYIDDNFLEKFKWTFEFIDTTNLLTFMNSPSFMVGSNPWRMYQGHNKDDDRQLSNWINVAKKEYDISLDGLNKVFEDLTVDEKLPHVSRSKELIEKIRTYPITAGGGLNKQGVLVPGHIITDKSVCTQYFRIDEQQLNELRSNEFITVLDYAHCPENAVFGADYVVKYRYPNMQDCLKLAKKYNIKSELVESVRAIRNEYVPELIAKALWGYEGEKLKIADLNDSQFTELTAGYREYGELIEAYERSLANPHAFPKEGERESVLAIKSQYAAKYKAFETELKVNSEFSGLLQRIEAANAKVLLGFVTNIIEDSTLSAIERYRKLVSVHFFSDFNGRSLRMFYRQEAKRPLYMSNWDFDITLPSSRNLFNASTTIDDFCDHEYRKYVNMFGALNREFLNSKRLGQVPDYYAVPEFWMAFFDINPKYYTEQEKIDLTHDLRKFYMTDGVQRSVEKKAYFDYMHDIMQFVYSSDKFKIKSIVDEQENSPLHLGCIYKFSIQCLNNLLKLADRQSINLLDLKNIHNENPAHVAAKHNNFSALSILLKQSPLLFAQLDEQGKTPYNNMMDSLYQSAKSGVTSLENIKIFIDIAKKLDIHKYDISEYRFDNNQTLAHMLAINSNHDAYNLLIGAFPSFLEKKDNNNKLPIDLLGVNKINKNKRARSLFSEFKSHSPVLDAEGLDESQMETKRKSKPGS